MEEITLALVVVVVPLVVVAVAADPVPVVDLVEPFQELKHPLYLVTAAVVVDTLDLVVMEATKVVPVVVLMVVVEMLWVQELLELKVVVLVVLVKLFQQITFQMHLQQQEELVQDLLQINS